MALNLFSRYPGRANPASIDYPQGSFKNKTAPAATDGTLLEQDWANDTQGFLQSLLKYRDLVANGEVDKVGASQYFDALFADPSETLRGMPLLATQAETNAGTNDAKVVTPKKLRAGFAISLDTNGYISFPSWMGGSIIQWGIALANGDSEAVYSFPLTFPTACRALVATPARSLSTTASTLFSGIRLIGLGQFGILNNTGTSNNSYWIAIGH